MQWIAIFNTLATLWLKSYIWLLTSRFSMQFRTLTSHRFLFTSQQQAQVVPQASVKLRPAANTPQDHKQACWILNMIFGHFPRFNPSSGPEPKHPVSRGLVNRPNKSSKLVPSTNRPLLCGKTPSLLPRISHHQAFCTGFPRGPADSWWLISSSVQDFPGCPCPSFSYLIFDP